MLLMADGVAIHDELDGDFRLFGSSIAAMRFAFFTTLS
jgi:hypothetical protein